MGFIISQKLTFKEAIDYLPKIEEWFRKNPTRKICQTETFKIRRGYLVEDVLKHTDLLS